MTIEVYGAVPILPRSKRRDRNCYGTAYFGQSSYCGLSLSMDFGTIHGPAEFGKLLEHKRRRKRVRFLEISLIVFLKVKGDERVYSPDILRFFDDDKNTRRVYRTCTERYVIPAMLSY
jgi:hypothetical protein